VTLYNGYQDNSSVAGEISCPLTSITCRVSYSTEKAEDQMRMLLNREKNFNSLKGEVIMEEIHHSSWLESNPGHPTHRQSLYWLTLITTIRAIGEKLIEPHLIKKFFTAYETRSYITMFKGIPLPEPVESGPYHLILSWHTLFFICRKI
jgi:hypothetical protein